MRESIVQIANQVLSYWWAFLIVGIAHILILKRQIIGDFMNNKETRSLKMFLPIVYRLVYPILGLALVFFSYAIISFVIGLLPVPQSPPDYSALQIIDFTSFIKYYSSYAGLFSVLGLIAAGLILVLSAGRKWFLILAGILAVLTFAYLITTAVIAF